MSVSTSLMQEEQSSHNESYSSNNRRQSDQNNNPNESSVHSHDIVNNNNSSLRRDFFEEIRNGGGHWSQLLRQVVLRAPTNNGHKDSTEDLILSQSITTLTSIPFQILGGSENGQFAYFGSLNTVEISEWLAVGYLQPGDILLDIQGQQVAGYTQADVLSLFHHCLQRNGATITVAPRGNLCPELRSYLNTRFQKGSVDHALQGVVRDNLYLRTVPVTTRLPRPGEIPGVDYTFLSPEEFLELEQNGSLLESGVYAGNHYGTPKPWARKLRPNSSESQIQTVGEGAPISNNSEGNVKILPGMHPSSEGKRRRNRSNVEALGAGDDEPPTTNQNNSFPQSSENGNGESVNELGPLPNNWEMSYTDKGEVYFIDHNTGTSHWLDPRLVKVQKRALEDCGENELPFGWERIEDPHYGTYYIDHVNRRTQFENPVLQAKGKGGTSENNSPKCPPPKKATPPVAPPKPTSHRLSLPALSSSTNLPHSLSYNSPTTNSHFSPSSSERPHRKEGGRLRPNFFTKDPSQLVGERIETVLLKSSRGLGFTIVGGDDDDGLDEFLQIKSVVTDGPAWHDGNLRTGDVLVRVNGRCVLGYTHQEMVGIFQSIGPGEEVRLQVCRGYPLPFDPSDPNTEIVTTVAVAPSHVTYRANTPDSVTHSLPELSAEKLLYGKSGRPASVDMLLDSPPQKKKIKHSGFESGIFLTLDIVKGTGGFGFTIADSVAGQKVKKVLDGTRCRELEEGDRLIAIDGIDLRGLSHTQVVQVLKDLPLGREATLTVQRLPDNYSQHKFNNHQMSNNLSDSRLQEKGRSKTPTADMGRPKIRDSLPERPKTPLLHPSSSSTQNGGSESYLSFSDRFHGLNLSSDQPPQIPLIRDWREMTIELQRRQEGFGFRIVGGTEEGSQVSVGHIVPRGAAALDGRLETGDQIVGVDGLSVLGASHHSVVQLMARSAIAGRVRLSLRRPIYEIETNSSIRSPPLSPSSTSLSPLTITLRRQLSEGFGFVIISTAAKAGATIGRIVEGSPADRCGQLHVGDRILAVNSIDISTLHHSQVVQLIKDSGLQLTLNIIPVLMSSGESQDFSSMKREEKINLFDMGTAFISPESQSLHFNSNMSNAMAYQQEPIEQVFSVTLNKGNRGFGFSIRGGKEFQNMKLFVLRLAEDGPAAIDGKIQVGDQILQINGINTDGMTHSQAIHIIKTGENVHLLLKRGPIPFAFLNQNFSSGFSSVNGQDEEQSLSSNNENQQYTNENPPMYKDYVQHRP